MCKLSKLQSLLLSQFLNSIHKYSSVAIPLVIVASTLRFYLTIQIHKNTSSRTL